jgi:hypothetical protein
MTDIHLYIEEAINGWRITRWEGLKVSKYNYETIEEALEDARSQLLIIKNTLNYEKENHE